MLPGSLFFLNIMFRVSIWSFCGVQRLLGPVPPFGFLHTRQSAILDQDGKHVYQEAASAILSFKSFTCLCFNSSAKQGRRKSIKGIKSRPELF